jgi:hypothetical protein
MLLRRDERPIRVAQVCRQGEAAYAMEQLVRGANGSLPACLQILQGRGISREHRTPGRAQAVEEELQVATGETVEARATGARQRPGELRQGDHQVTDGDVGTQLTRALCACDGRRMINPRFLRTQ